MFDRILSPVQSAWFITEAYPLKFDCRALATAVFQLWGHMQLAPGPVLQQQQAAARQQAVAPARNMHPHELSSRAMLQPTQQQQRALQGIGVAAPHRLEAQQAGLRQQLQASQQQQSAMPRVPASLNLSEAQHSLGQAGLTQAALLAHQQRQQQQQRQLQLLQQQQQSQQQRSSQPQVARSQQAMPNSLLQQAQVGQRNLPASAGLLQGQGMDKRQWQQLLQQQLGMPVRQQGPVMPQLTALQQAAARQPTAGLLDQRTLMGLGALQRGSSAMLAGAVPRPAGGSHLPMAVP